ncbi:MULTISPECIES: N-6 DNA methylase [Calothrix]|uniref:site-specific DNA-methyltransferase (adenine-specific) n=2 Tax=Calothrix TaxID=1186 RepID=A0ABR8A466_9CYAN|nr:MULTISPECIES: N-6 DNA methylase [Calothrix]MBD2194190.1 N-6 DNA methylase [Calothrix parietina FACHB-288]MBD2224986.1 N-6 DNA methylase [Calothrix anomala FACHB-343]
MNSSKQRDIKEELWKVLDTYRASGKVGVNIVIHATVFLFLRWADFYEAEQEAIAAFDGFEYNPSLPHHLRWPALKSLSKYDLEKLWRNELPASLKALIHVPLGQLLRHIAYVIEFNPPYLAEPLFQLFCWVDSLPFETPEDRSACGMALESLISQASFAKDGGQFTTPQSIVSLMVALADPKPGERIYDPCFGMGGLLVASVRYMMKRAYLLPPKTWLDMRDNSIFGVEIDSVPYVIGFTRLLLEGIDRPCIELGNTLDRPLTQAFTGSPQLRNPPSREAVFERPRRSPSMQGNLESSRTDEGFDCILAVPPWGSKQNTYGYPNHFPIPVGSMEGLFLEHVMYSLRPGGRAVIALPDGVLFRHGQERKLRERLLTDFCVEGVLALPAGAFAPYTGISCNLIVIHRNTPAPSVRFFQLDEFLPNRQKATNFTPIELELRAKEVVSIFRANETTENLWNTSIDSLAQRDWELVVKRSGDTALLKRLEDLQNADPKLKVQSLRDVAEVFFSIANHQYRNYTTKNPRDSEVAANILRASDMRDFGIREPELFLTRFGEARLEGKLKPESWLRPGDIVLSTSGKIGKVAFFTDSAGFRKTLAADGIVVIRSKDEIVTPQFLFTLFRSPVYQQWLTGHAHGMSVQHLSVQTLKDLAVPVPAIALQDWLWKQTEGRNIDALNILLQGITGTAEDPILKWLERSKAVAAIGIHTEDSEYRLRWLNQFIKELLDFRNQWAHSQLRQISPEITPWLARMADAAIALRNIQDIPSGTGRIAVLENAQITVQEALINLNTASISADPIRKVSSNVSRLISQEINLLLENFEVEINLTPTSVVLGIPNEVALKIKNIATVALRNLHIRTSPKIGTGATAYLKEDEEFSIPLLIEPQQVSGTFDFLVLWTAQRLDGTSVHGEISLALAIRSLRESFTPANLGASPYIVGKPIERKEMFYGRDDVIEQIKDLLNDETQSNVILLEGNRRAGKTSILKQLQQRDNLPNWLMVECSLQGADSMATRDVFRLFARKIWEACSEVGISTWLPSQLPPTLDKPIQLQLVKALSATFSGDNPFEEFELYLQSVLKTIQPRKLLLMLDEFDKLQEGIDKGITNPQVPENIRYLLHTYSDMSAIITGSRRLKRLREEYWSVLFGFGYQIGISSLPLNAARNLVTEPVKGRLQFLPEARDRIVSLCACQPFLIQSLCTRVFEQAKRQAERTVTPTLVESAATAMVEDNEHFRTLWNYAGTERRRMILAICQRFVGGDDPTNLDFLETKFEEFGVRVPQKRGLGEDLDFLRELELIEFDSTKGREAYALSIPLMEKWIQRHVDVEDLKREAIRESEEIL